MDILYSGKVDGFCIVSSDSDFTKLASRLRESGMMVIGMGEAKTPAALIAAYNKFVNLDAAKAEEESWRLKRKKSMISAAKHKKINRMSSAEER